MSSQRPVPRPRLRHLLPSASGDGVHLVAAADGERVRRGLAEAGYAVARADLASPDQQGPGQPTPGQPGQSGQDPAADTLDAAPRPTSIRTAQAAIAAALRLPETAGRNLDALVDSLRDLATWWPDDQQVALVLEHAERVVDGDLPGWHTLTEILREATDDLWRGGEDGDRVLVTVALIDGHGVPTLPPANSADTSSEDAAW